MVKEKKEEDRRYSISDVSEMTEVPQHVLRQWEERFPQLRPKRTRTNRRYYTTKDVEVVRRIRELLWHERMTTEGARVRLAQEVRGEGRPRTRAELVDLIDRMEEIVREMLDIAHGELPPRE